jgi:phosphoadenosine phosphosulfate reductase
MNVDALNEKYYPLRPEQRIRELYNDFNKVLYTSSFGTTAAYLLYQFSKIHPDQQIYFLETTYHFPETLEYKAELTRLLKLNVTELKGDAWRNQFTSTDQTWKKDPDLCCSINKVEPLEKIKTGYEVWVSGLMGSQTKHRKDLKIFQQGDGLLKFYPIIDQTEEQINTFMLEQNLPNHPLKSKGYNSVGCIHCTAQGKAREGRWVNKSKTECGIHLK